MDFLEELGHRAEYLGVENPGHIEGLLKISRDPVTGASSGEDAKGLDLNSSPSPGGGPSI